MNTLSYGLLSLLSKHSRSGYELMQHLQMFWPAKHSQIYPLLALLEQKGHVTFVHVPQSDKPDKKVYSLSEQGKAALREWIAMPTDDPVTRDELALKVYSIGLVDKLQAWKTLEAREVYYKKKKERFILMLEKLKQEVSKPLDELEIEDYGFSMYVMLHKATMKVDADLVWCEWMHTKLLKT